MRQRTIPIVHIIILWVEGEKTLGHLLSMMINVLPHRCVDTRAIFAQWNESILILNCIAYNQIKLKALYLEKRLLWQKKKIAMAKKKNNIKIAWETK